MINWKKESSKLITTVFGIISFTGVQITKALDKVSKHEKELIMYRKDLEGATEKLNNVLNQLEDISSNFETSVGSIDGTVATLNLKLAILQKDVEYLKDKIILTTLLCFFILIPSFTFDELNIIYTLMPSVENIKIENSTIYIYEKEDTAINDINYSLAFSHE